MMRVPGGAQLAGSAEGTAGFDCVEARLRTARPRARPPKTNPVKMRGFRKPDSEDSFFSIEWPLRREYSRRRDGGALTCNRRILATGCQLLRTLRKCNITG